MPEVTGTITEAIADDKQVKVKVATEQGNRSVKAWKRMQKNDEWFDNPVVTKLVKGKFGTFIGEIDKWQTSDGQPRETFVITEFKEQSQPSTNGGSPLPVYSGSSSSPRSAIEITATELSGQAAEIVHHLIAIGVVKDVTEAQTFWLSLTSDAVTLHRQLIKEEASADS